MTPRKPKPRKPAPRKAAGPTMEQRLDAIECEIFPPKHYPISSIRALAARVAMLETRSRYRDASHDEPVSNASEAIGHFTLTEPERPWWRRFLDHMGAP